MLAYLGTLTATTRVFTRSYSQYMIYTATVFMVVNGAKYREKCNLFKASEPYHLLDST